MSHLMMDNEYDASFDVGVAVKEESPEAVAKSEKKKKHRGRGSNNGKLRPRPRLRSGSTSSTDNEAGKSATDLESTDNADRRRTDDRDSAPATVGSGSSSSSSSTAGAEKKSKKKRRREKKSSNSNTDDGSTSNEGISKSIIHAAFADGVERKRQKKAAVLPPSLPLKGMFVNERTNLPVYQHSAEIVDLISNNDVLLVVAETVRKTVYPFMHRLYFFCRSQFFLNADPHFFPFVPWRKKKQIPGQRKIDANTCIRPRKRIAEKVREGGDHRHPVVGGIAQAQVRTHDMRDATPSRRGHHTREAGIGGDELHPRNDRGTSREVRRHDRRRGAQHD